MDAAGPGRWISGVPGVDQADAASFEIAHVPGGHHGPPGAGDGGNLTVRLAGWTAGRGPIGGYGGITATP